MDELQRNRLFAGGALLLVLFVGYSFSSSYAGATEEQVQAVMAKRVTRGDQQSKVLARGKRFENTPEHFVFELSQDLELFALRELTAEALGEPNAWRLLVDKSDPERLRSGRTYAGDGISIKASTTKVRYRRHGVTVKSVHAVAKITNTSPKPLAYRVELEPAQGRMRPGGSGASLGKRARSGLGGSSARSSRSRRSGCSSSTPTATGGRPCAPSAPSWTPSWSPWSERARAPTAALLGGRLFTRAKTFPTSARKS